MTSFHLGRRFVRWCFELWRSTQVELHGQYGIEHLNALHTYATRTHWSRVALVCLLIPLPATITIILLDLIPLEPIEKGPNATGVWTRFVLTGTVVSTSTMYQLRPYVPWMKLTTCLMWTIGFAATIIAVIALWQLSLVVGYPLPFITIVSVPVISTVMSTALFCFRYTRIREQKDLVREMVPPVNVISCQVFMMVIYPLYNHIFAQLASLEQTAFVLLLPVIKIVCRLWINRSIRDSRDASPEVIIFNVEVFHSLFVANCMQSSTTTRTVLVLVLIDFLQACISWWDVRTLLREIQQLMSTTGPESTKW